MAQPVNVVLFLLQLVPAAVAISDLNRFAFPGVESRWSASTNAVVLQRVSQQALLTCGFFSSDNSTSTKFSVYVNRWDDSTELWRLNITMSQNATLEFGQDGNLVLREADNSVIWSSNTKASRMELLETGNLVLYHADGVSYAWQSFDQPSAYKLLTGQSLKVGQRLVDDSLGDRVYLEVQAHQVVLCDARFNPPYPYGAWMSPGQEIVGMRLERNFSIALVDERGEVIEIRNISDCFGEQSSGFGSLWLHNGKMTVSCSNISFGVVSDITFFQDFYTETCSSPLCGGNGICELNDCVCPQGRVGDQTVTFTRTDIFPLACQPPDFRKSKGWTLTTQLMELPRVDHLVNPFLSGFKDLSLHMCKKLCLENSSCNGLSFRTLENGVSTLCQLADVLLLRNLSETSANVTTFIKVELPVTNSRSLVQPERRRNKHKIILVSAVMAGLSTLIGIALFICRRRPVTSESKDQPRSDIFLATLPRRFSYQDLCQMTSNFTFKLGRGAFGLVYKGTFEQTPVAVKCLQSGRHGQEQFETEAMTIGRIHHKNLVKLLGFGVEKPSYFLVYELMANVSLDRWLFRDELGFLDWEKRFNICLDIARGMSYLHQECSPPVLHLDIKPSNILLDERFHAKICDFGLARLADGEKSLTEAGWRGTPGYIAPEWLHGKVTEKADVFSFGVVVLEIVAGRRRAEVMSAAHSLLRTEKREEVSSVIDRRLVEDGVDVEQVFQVIKVALKCTSEDPSRRPSMSKVVNLLSD